MQFHTLTLPESVGNEYIVATYYMNNSDEADLHAWVRLVAADQSAGTWTHVEGETPEVVEQYGAKVTGIYPMGDEHACVARIAFPIANFQPCASMLMSTVAGNVLGQKGIKLVDIHFPDGYLENFPGPLVGIDGIRKILGVEARPLMGAILKPCIGVPPEASAEGAAKAAVGGADVIKDDELLGDPAYSPMVARVRAVMGGLKAVGKDKSVLYAVNITGDDLLERAKRAIDAGANAIMVNFQSMGWGATESLTRALKRESTTIPVFGHSAGMGAYYRSATNGISQPLSVGKLARIIGMDMPLVYPDSGRFGIATSELVETHAACIAPLGGLKRAFTTVAGGVHPGTIEYLMGLLGNDTILMAGGGIYGHPDGATAGAKGLLQAIEAVHGGSTVAEAAKTHRELAAALDFWGK